MVHGLDAEVDGSWFMVHGLGSGADGQLTGWIMQNN